jgi:phage minor structural protein
MYQIYADGGLIYDGRYDDYVIGKGQISLEVNKSGSFVFSLYRDHPYYDRMTKLKTIITVYRDGTLIFRGRVIKSVEGFYGDKTFTCEGELSFLLDSIQRAYSFTGSPEELFRQFISTHNAQVGKDKRFILGQVTVTDPNDYITRANSTYEDTLTNLTSKLVESLGGYIVITSGTDGDRVISWLEDYPYEAAQTIEFGENLLDFSRQNSAEAMMTALIPLGAMIETEGSEEEKRVTIESVNGGKDYIFDQTAVDQYGWIFKTAIWDDVTVPANLLTKARTYLAESVNLNISLELSAVDLSAMDKDIKAFRLGDHIHVISEPHEVNARYLLTKQSVDLLHPESDRITLGYTFSTFTDTTLDNAQGISQKVNVIENSYASNSSVKEQIEESTDYIKTEVLGAYATVEMLNDYATLERLADELTALNDQIQGDIAAAVTGDWIDLTISAGFEAYGGEAAYQPQVKVIGDMISIRGVLAASSAVPAGVQTVIAEGIPETARPSYDLTVLSSGGVTYTVMTDGTLTIVSASGIAAGTRLPFAIGYDV